MTRLGARHRDRYQVVEDAQACSGVQSASQCASCSGLCIPACSTITSTNSRARSASNSCCRFVTGAGWTGSQDGNTGDHSPLAGRRQPASDCGEHQIVLRDTVTRYVAAASAEGIDQDGPVATEEQLSRLAAMGQVGPRQVEMPSQDLLEPWADQIYQWLTGDWLLLTRIHELLLVRGVPCQPFLPNCRRLVLPPRPLRLAPLHCCFSPVAGDDKLHDDGVTDHPVNRRGGGHGVGEDAFPL